MSARLVLLSDSGNWAASGSGPGAFAFLALLGLPRLDLAFGLAAPVRSVSRRRWALVGGDGDLELDIQERLAKPANDSTVLDLSNGFG